MDAEPCQKEHGPLQVRRRHSRRKPTRLDHRTRVGRRAGELREHFTALLDAAGRDVSAVELASAISRAAELQAISEQLRADALRGLPISPDDLVRLERLSAQAVRWLRLSNAVSKPAPSLAEYLQQQAAE
jgi:hypothetical protein